MTDLVDRVARVRAAIKQLRSATGNASECLDDNTMFQDCATGRAIYVRDLRPIIDALEQSTLEIKEYREALSKIEAEAAAEHVGYRSCLDWIAKVARAALNHHEGSEP